MQTFSAFSPLNGGQLSTYYNDRTYPLDLNGAQDYTRPATAFAVFGYPYSINYLAGLVPQFTNDSLAMAYGEKPSGPWTGTVPWELTTIFPNIQGGLPKLKG